MPQRRRAIVALLALAVAGFPAAGSSAEAWLPPQIVSEHDNMPGLPVGLVADAEGAMTAVWQGNDADGLNRVWWASRPAGSTRFTTASPLSEEGRRSANPAVAVNASGAAVVAWMTSQDDGTWSVEGVTRPAAGAGFTQVTFSTDTTGADANDRLDVGVDAAGRVSLVYVSLDDSGQGRVQAVTGVAGSTSWATPQPISDAGTGPGLLQPRLDVSTAGRATAVWTLPTQYGYIVQTNDRAPGGAWRTTPLGLSVPLVLDQYTQYAVVASDAAGRVIVAWPAQTSSFTDGWVQAAVRQPGATSFGLPFPAGPTIAGYLEDLDAVMTSGGAAAIAWREEREGPGDRLWVTTFSGFGDATSHVVGDGLWNIGTPSIAVAPDDALVVAWTAVNLSLGDEVLETDTLRVARRPAGGAFGPPVTLAVATNEGAATAVSAAGEVTIGHLERDSETGRESYRVVDLDASPPVLTGLTVPATATVGQPASMSAVASDRWSEPVTLHWDFGDGSGATGADVGHAYTGPGTFQVRLTATDGSGNATTLVRAVTVSAAAAPAPTADTTAPVLTRARLKPALLPTGIGAKLQVTSSEAARLVGKIASRTNGKWRAAGTKRWSAKAGRNTLPFYGKSAERRLESGTYRVLLIAADAAGNQSRQVTVRFRVDRG